MKWVLISKWEVGPALYRVKLAVHKETGECVAVKIVHVDEKREGGLTYEALRKEVW